MEQKQSKLITEILSCSRCGQDHARLTFKRLKEPIEDSDGTVWDYWAYCPTNLEPILMKVSGDKPSTGKLANSQEDE